MGDGELEIIEEKKEERGEEKSKEKGKKREEREGEAVHYRSHHVGLSLTTEVGTS